MGENKQEHETAVTLFSQQKVINKILDHGSL